MKKLLILLLICLPCFAATYDVRYVFNSTEADKYSTPDYEYQKGQFDHVETIDIYTNDHYYALLMIPKYKAMQKSVIIYGKNYEELRYYYKLNNELMYKDKSIFGKIKHRLNEKYWDNADILNSLPLGWNKDVQDQSIYLNAEH